MKPTLDQTRACGLAAGMATRFALSCAISLALPAAPACAAGHGVNGVNGDAERGRAAIAQHDCVACHAIPGIHKPGNNVGPPLDQIATRGYIAGVLANTPQKMVRWLLDPPAVDSLTAMPNLGLSEAEAKDIAAYLDTLK